MKAETNKLSLLLLCALFQVPMTYAQSGTQNTEVAENTQVAPQTAQSTKQKIDNDTAPLYVEGNYADDAEVEESDSELNFIQNELGKQKKQIRINDKKTKGYKKLQTTTEKLSDTTERYVEEKKESEKIIKEYNEKINCLLDESNLDPACEKYKNSSSDKKAASASKEVQEKSADDSDAVMLIAPATGAAAAAAQAPASAPAAPVSPVIIQNFNQPAAPAAKAEAAAPPVIEKTTTESAAPKAPVAEFPGDAQVFADEEAYSVKELDSTAKSPSFVETVRVIPYIGMRTYSGTGINGNQTDSSFGLRLESEVVNRFILGAGFQYDTLTSQELNNNFGYSPGYYGFYGQGGREVEYTTWSLDLLAKVILIKGERFRPYLGGAIGYNNGELSYTDNRQYPSYYNATMFGDNETISTSFVTGSIMAGTDFLFTENIGLNLEMAFIKGMNNLNDQNINYFDWDMQRLQELSEQFAEASSVSFRAGVTVSF
jgi:opacity protein-like surface antigen